MAAIPADVLPQVAPPSLFQTGLEYPRIVMETVMGLAKLPFCKRHATAATCSPVLVIPGFGATDASTWALRHRIELAGHKVYAWELGRNKGPERDTLSRLVRRIKAISKECNAPVQLVGWSLGGVFARIAASRAKHHVSRVVALGSPLTGDPRCSRLSRLIELACGRSLACRRVRAMIRSSASVPVTSIFSKSDGVVGWQASVFVDGDCEPVEVESSHMGLVVKPDVLERVVEVLARPSVPFATLHA